MYQRRRRGRLLDDSSQDEYLFSLLLSDNLLLVTKKTWLLREALLPGLYPSALDGRDQTFDSILLGAQLRSSGCEFELAKSFEEDVEALLAPHLSLLRKHYHYAEFGSAQREEEHIAPPF